MAALPWRRGSSRNKAAATNPPADRYPKNFYELFYAIVDDDNRTKNSLRVMNCVARILLTLLMVGCFIGYVIAAAAKGFRIDAFTLPELAPGGVVGCGTLAYVVWRAKQWFKSRGDAAAPDDAKSTGGSPA